MLDTMIVSLIS